MRRCEMGVRCQDTANPGLTHSYLSRRTRLVSVLQEERPFSIEGYGLIQQTAYPSLRFENAVLG